MKIEKIEETISIDPREIVRLTEMGNITKIMYSKTRSHGGYITKLDCDHYADNKTGEVKEFKHIKNRSQDLQNVAKSLKKLRRKMILNLKTSPKNRAKNAFQKPKNRPKSRKKFRVKSLN